MQRTTLSRSTVLFGEMLLKPLPKMLTSLPPLADPRRGRTSCSTGCSYWTNSALYGLKVPEAPPLSETVTSARRGVAVLEMTHATRSLSSNVPSTSSPSTAHTSCPPPKSKNPLPRTTTATSESNGPPGGSSALITTFATSYSIQMGFPHSDGSSVTPLSIAATAKMEIIPRLSLPSGASQYACVELTTVSDE